MGFPACCCGLAIPTLLFHIACTLCYIKIVICRVLHFVGIVDCGEPDSSSWQDFPDVNSSSVPSFSADTIRDSLPLATFGMFAEILCESVGNDIVCTFCLSSFDEEDEVRELYNCRHIFHRNCLDKWLDQRQTTCPLCRSSLIPTTILETELNLNNNSWVVDQIAYIFGEDLVITP